MSKGSAIFALAVLAAGGIATAFTITQWSLLNDAYNRQCGGASPPAGCANIENTLGQLQYEASGAIIFLLFGAYLALSTLMRGQGGLIYRRSLVRIPTSSAPGAEVKGRTFLVKTCPTCKTNWDGALVRCPRCGMLLRDSV